MADFFNDFLDIIKYHAEPVLIESDGNYTFANAPAKKLFGTDKEDCIPPVSEWAPKDILNSEAQGISGKADIGGNTYSVIMMHLDNYRVFTLSPFNKRDEEKYDVFATINESIRAPLAMLSSAANAMLPIIEGSGSEVLSKNLAVIFNNYYRLLRLSNFLSNYYELKTQGIKLNLNSVDLLSLCRNLVDTVSLLTKERGVKIWFRTSLESANTEADFDKIEYILLNILSNKLKYTSIGDDITVDLSRSSDSFVITITASGVQTPDFLLQKVFDPRLEYQMLNETEIKYGIGFAYSSSIIQAHGGSILMENRAGLGTTIKFTLPVKSGNRLADKPVRYGESGMIPILTELSDILSLDCYDAKYMD